LRPLPAPILKSRGPAGPPSQLIWNLDLIGVSKVWEMGISGQGLWSGNPIQVCSMTILNWQMVIAGGMKGMIITGTMPGLISPNPMISGAWYPYAGDRCRNQVGVAPDAEWIGCLNMARNFGNPAYYLDCLQFLFAPFPHGGDPLQDGQPERGAHILNNSWGCPPIEGCDTEVLSPALAALRSAGVFVVVSAGNSGFAGCESVRQPPALHPAALLSGRIECTR
jgi:hypothetical protein